MLNGPAFGPAKASAPTSLVVLLHGLGADGNDLIGLAPTLATSLPGTLFVAPDAPSPCDMGPYGRQWFSLHDRRPAALMAGVRKAAPAADAYLDRLLERHRLPPARLALLGFSQGTMTGLHVALRRTEPLAGVVGFSGALIGPELLASEVRSRPPVLLVHGDADDIVPTAALHAAVAGLSAAEVPVTWIIRPGLPHAIDPEGLAAAAGFLADVLAR